MRKYYLHNSALKDSEVVILGVPDESGSHSKRARGVSLAPDAIRKTSWKEDVFDKKGVRKVHGQSGLIKKKIHDMGNIAKSQIPNKIASLVNDKRIPIVIGGDHSVTTDVLKGFEKTKMKGISVIYFDAHPDFRCAEEQYYGSVICDISKLKNFKMSKSVEIGIRVPEEEEIKNIKSGHLLTFTPFDIEDLGIKRIFGEIRKRVGKNIYISVDMDVIDPAFAPGVDTPVPGGLSSTQLIYLIKKISELGIVGFDITELNPRYDIQNRTLHLASRIIAEAVNCK